MMCRASARRPASITPRRPPAPGTVGGVPRLVLPGFRATPIRLTVRRGSQGLTEIQREQPVEILRGQFGEPLSLELAERHRGVW